MPDPDTASLRVAIIANTPRQRLNLKSILESNGLCVVNDEDFIAALKSDAAVVADALLVDLDESSEQDEDILDEMIAQLNLPVLFNDSAATRNQYSAGGEAWGKRLAEKLVKLVSSRPASQNVTGNGEQARTGTDTNKVAAVEAAPASVEDQAPGQHDYSDVSMREFDDMVAEHITTIDEALKSLEDEDDDIDLDKYERKIAEYKSKLQAKEQSPGKVKERIPERPDFQCNTTVINPVKSEAAEQLAGSARTRPVVTHHQTGKDPQGADRVWILGASIGGPQAVEEFLMALPEELPCAFVIAQHIGPGFVPLLAEQLDRKCKLQVSGPVSGRLLRNSQVVVSPVHQRIVFNQTGHVILKPVVEKTTYSPSIDAVLTEVANRFGPNAGAIIFSGMGNDGMQGVQVMKEKGGMVWAQDAESCVISAMADCARRTGSVEYSGTPTQLARRLTNYLRKHS